MLNFILVEAALEVAPAEIQNHPQIKTYARKVGKKPGEVLLDKSYHYQAMGNLQFKEKRGRPDIVHFTLLEVLGSPLNLEGLIKTYIHTIVDYVIYVNPKTRLPRNYNRFTGLIEQLFQTGKVPLKGEALLTLEKINLEKLIKKVNPSKTFLLTEKGKPLTPTMLAEKLEKEADPTIMVGGFPHGEFKDETLKLADEKIRIDPKPLDTWIVASRIMAAYEAKIRLPEKRLKLNQQNHK
ncbi:MAG: 16S rRNA methyltransferase [Candidatus Bathyarchaeota archaeon]|nr:16S rRNA methyltransferase [Candidatus Bathyarchaeota archaeon]